MRRGKTLLAVAPILFGIATTTVVGAMNVSNTVSAAMVQSSQLGAGERQSLGGNYAVQVPTYRAVPVYNSNGQMQSRALAGGTAWATHDQIVFKDNAGNVKGVYFRVSTTEYINAADVYFYIPRVQNIRVNSQLPARLVDSDGNAIGSRALGAGTVWYSDQIIKVHGVVRYRVATNEFASVGDVEPC